MRKESKTLYFKNIFNAKRLSLIQVQAKIMQQHVPAPVKSLKNRSKKPAHHRSCLGQGSSPAARLPLEIWAETHLSEEKVVKPFFTENIFNANEAVFLPVLSRDAVSKTKQKCLNIPCNKKNMEIIPGDTEEAGLFLSGWLWIKGIPTNAVAKLVEIARQARKIAADDPRKLIHSLKVGLALTLVSLFYYFQPLYSSFGVSAMWAVMTVVVVFEFSVGATLGKGLNRGLATLAAGALGLAAHHLATVTGKTCEPILIGLFVFLQAVASTFIRFFPRVKARYDYGVLIFILTFCLVSISGLRTDEILDLAQKRFSTIVIGASTCLTVSIFVYPVWAGEDLHKLVAKNIEKLGSFLEAFGDECFRRPEASESLRSTLVGLQSILDSKSSEETLVNFARWEPGHGQFMYRHPWKQYLKIASLTRQCAYRVEALNGYLNSQTHAPQDIQEIISRMSSESGKALKELAWTVETMTRPSSCPDSHESNLKIASKNLHSLLKCDFWEEQTNILLVIPVAAVASLLNDIISCVGEIADAIHELSSLANFKERDKEINVTHFSIVVDEGEDQVKQESKSSVKNLIV